SKRSSSTRQPKRPEICSVVCCASKTLLRASLHDRRFPFLRKRRDCSSAIRRSDFGKSMQTNFSFGTSAKIGKDLQVCHLFTRFGWCDPKWSIQNRLQISCARCGTKISQTSDR